MQDKVTFNINAELYENKYAELAIKLAGGRVYENVGLNAEADFAEDAAAAILHRHLPEVWHELPAHELNNGREWHRIARFGFVDGDEKNPAVELEVGPDDMGDRARTYLRRALS